MIFRCRTTFVRPIVQRVRFVSTILPGNNNFTYDNNNCFALDKQKSLRPFSSLSLPPLAPPQPPNALNEDIIKSIHIGVMLYLRYGLGRQRLLELHSNENVSLVLKWQRCMETYLGVQLHVLAGLGYPPDESGITMYQRHLLAFLQPTNLGDTSVGPDVQEQIRIANRDAWRLVLCTAFNVDANVIQELPIHIARSIMHSVAQRMQDKAVLDEIAKRCASIVPNENPQMEVAQRHHAIQEVLISMVYMWNDAEVVKEAGFEPNEIGYIKLQLAVTDHQNDPLIAQYIGHSMMQIMQVAGLTEHMKGSFSPIKES